VINWGSCSQFWLLTILICCVTQTSLDNEHVNAALSHEIRQRAAILQNLAQGWIAGPDENSTELEYLAANQQQLKECDENITDLSAALNELPSYLESISAVVEAISSLPLAKSTLKRLIELLYSQMRLNIAIASEVDAVDVEEPSVHQAKQAQSNVDLKELLQKEKKNHDDELKDVMDIVAAAVPDISLNRDQTDQLAQKYAAANAKIKELEEIERCHAQKLEKSEAESAKMEQRIRELEESLKANELKRESIRLMDVSTHVVVLRT
jgi:chromosome segregation ATPase